MMLLICLEYQVLVNDACDGNKYIYFLPLYIIRHVNKKDERVNYDSLFIYKNVYEHCCDTEVRQLSYWIFLSILYLFSFSKPQKLTFSQWIFIL